MLDNETKKRIDIARDILVGKVPDPKSQVEQITIALIYKFMDDMDKEAIEFGGNASFFIGEYEKYSWTKLLSPQVGGQEMLELYAEAIIKLNQNPNIPQLFRDIFKNAYLPYRDPETLKMFLKNIHTFRYDHSEMLGDAFEYLLSVLGSQGDAGQFRTPRHIIDFIVQLIAPQKNETVCDPACGTAGFLISAYKYILEQNTAKTKGDLLAYDEKNKLMNNFIGYDISPDMVRLSLVNLYLHGFPAPNISEYDTLTSEDKWHEYADIILANPPFMTPKGGIKPHKRFGINATKSEVLFTDYIAEHIHPITGRAAIIVPNGIVATTQTAYKELRKILIKNGLVAVISLPAGVFQPYSGVKTSILILDKRLAKKTTDLLFLKVENDGYDLGAQRRQIEKNDLPKVLDFYQKYSEAILNEQEMEDKHIFHFVKKEIVLANKDVILNGDRYTTKKEVVTNFEIIKLNEICDITSSKRIFQNDYVNEGIPFYRTKEIVELSRNKEISVELFITKERYNEIKNSFSIPRKGDLLVSAVGTIGIIWLIPNDNEFYFKDGNLIWIRNLRNIMPNYLKYILEDYLLNNKDKISDGAAYSALTIIKLKEVEIPLPSLEVQQQIVAEIEGYQKIIDGAKQVVENYKPTISIKAEWEMVELGEVCEIQSGGTPARNVKEYWQGEIPWYSSGELNELFTVESKEFITEEGLKKSNAKVFPKGSLLIGMYDTAAFKMSILDRDGAFNQAICGVRKSEKVNLTFLYLYFLMNREEYLTFRTGARQRNLSKEFITKVKIPLLPLEEQQQIVAKIEEEQALVDANKRLIVLFEEKIKRKIGEVWGNEEKSEK